MLVAFSVTPLGVGEDEARSLESRAQEKANEHINALLAEPDAERESDSEPESTS